MRKRHVAAGLAGVVVFAFVVLTADHREMDASGRMTPSDSEAGRLLSARVAVPVSARVPAAEGTMFHVSPRTALVERFAAVTTASVPDSRETALASAWPKGALVEGGAVGIPFRPLVPAATVSAAGGSSSPAEAPKPEVRAVPAKSSVESLGRGRFRDRHGVYRMSRALVTAYCPCRQCCGSYARGITSLGTSAWSEGAAADPLILPYGTRVYVPGYGLTSIDDTGGAMRQSRERGVLHLDMRMTYHYEARRWGRQYLAVRIYE